MKPKAALPEESPTSQLEGFISKFDPEVAKLIRKARALLRKRLPTAIEQVYDNYNFLAIGCCSTERTSDCIVSLAASSNGVILSFYYGELCPIRQRSFSAKACRTASFVSRKQRTSCARRYRR